MNSKSGKIKQAIILAGGEGRRLHPYSKVLPKPLWPVGNVPIVVIMIKQLAAAGIKEIVMAVGHQADLIKMIIGDGRQYGVNISYSLEKKPLGTAAPLKKIKKLDSNFLVLNGDLLTNLSFKTFSERHLKNNAPATIAVCNRAVKIDFGVVLNDNDIITGYSEKPRLKYAVSMGIYAFNREILKYIPNKKFDFPELVDKLIISGTNPKIYKFKGQWLDIGRLDDWEKANRIFQKNPGIFL